MTTQQVYSPPPIYIPEKKEAFGALAIIGIVVAGVVVAIVVAMGYSAGEKTERTETRQAGRTDRTETRQDAKTNRRHAKNCKKTSCTKRFLGICVERDSEAYAQCVERTAAAQAQAA